MEWAGRRLSPEILRATRSSSGQGRGWPGTNGWLPKAFRNLTLRLQKRGNNNVEMQGQSAVGGWTDFPLGRQRHSCFIIKCGQCFARGTQSHARSLTQRLELSETLGLSLQLGALCGLKQDSEDLPQGGAAAFRAILLYFVILGRGTVLGTSSWSEGGGHGTGSAPCPSKSMPPLLSLCPSHTVCIIKFCTLKADSDIADPCTVRVLSIFSLSWTACGIQASHLSLLLGPAPLPLSLGPLPPPSR